MKILFLTDNFPPETNAPATRTYEHCKEWVKQGVEVTVITCAPNFPKGKVFDGYKNKLYQKEEIDGIKVIRVWSYISANKGFIKRVLDFMSFMMSAFFVGLFIKTDKIIATSPQFFTAIAGRWLSFWKHKPWVMEVRDIWPESIVAVGASKRNSIIKYFEWLENRMYKSADQIVVVTNSFKETLVTKNNVNPNKIAVFKNGANLTLFSPREKDKNLLDKLGLKDKFIIGYIGTHGMAHALDFVLKSAKDIKDKNIHIVLIGAGAAKEQLIELKTKLGLTNVSLLPPVSKEEIPHYISILDVGLVNLKRSPTFESVIPSKMFELAAMHKPLLHGVAGESKQLVLDYNIGQVFEPENKTEFLTSIEKIKVSTGPFGFNSFLADHDRVTIANQMLKFIQ